MGCIARDHFNDPWRCGANVMGSLRGQLASSLTLRGEGSHIALTQDVAFGRPPRPKLSGIDVVVYRLGGDAQYVCGFSNRHDLDTRLLCDVCKYAICQITRRRRGRRSGRFECCFRTGSSPSQGRCDQLWCSPQGSGSSHPGIFVPRRHAACRYRVDDHGHRASASVQWSHCPSPIPGLSQRRLTYAATATQPGNSTRSRARSSRSRAFSSLSCSTSDFTRGVGMGLVALALGLARIPSGRAATIT